MKYLLFIFLFLFSCLSLFAKKGKVTSALKYTEQNKLEKALETINIAIEADNTINWPRTWEVRGEIYQAIFQSDNEKLKEQNQNQNPLTMAFNSYKKALELDNKDKYSKSLKIKLNLLTNDLTNQASKAYEAENYAMALQSFEHILSIDTMSIIKADSPELVDTVVIFNAGLAAFNSKDFDKAIKYYEEAAKYGYNGARTYGLIAKAYEQKDDIAAALSVLKEGLEKYPDDNGILASMISFYMKSDKSKEAMKYLEVAIKHDPQNVRYYFAQGSLFEKIGNKEKAIHSYQKAIEADGQYFDAYYNLGALFYNKGVEQIDLASNIPANQNEKYKDEINKANVWFDKSLPFLEKCDQIQPNNPTILESLKNLYYRLKQLDKYNAVLIKLGS